MSNVESFTNIGGISMGARTFVKAARVSWQPSTFPAWSPSCCFDLTDSDAFCPLLLISKTGDFFFQICPALGTFENVFPCCSLWSVLCLASGPGSCVCCCFCWFFWGSVSIQSLVPPWELHRTGQQSRLVSCRPTDSGQHCRTLVDHFDSQPAPVSRPRVRPRRGFLDPLQPSGRKRLCLVNRGCHPQKSLQSPKSCPGFEEALARGTTWSKVAFSRAQGWRSWGGSFLWAPECTLAGGWDWAPEPSCIGKSSRGWGRTPLRACPPRTPPPVISCIVWLLSICWTIKQRWQIGRNNLWTMCPRLKIFSQRLQLIDWPSGHLARPNLG